jgi:CheY-like chemotaxis protein
MSQEKVLIVEDEENERTGLAELVSAWGYRAETARDGAEGLEKVTNWSPSIVVTDLKMPRMGGLELLERLSTDAQTMAQTRPARSSRARNSRCRPSSNRAAPKSRRG